MSCCVASTVNRKQMLTTDKHSIWCTLFERILVAFDRILGVGRHFTSVNHSELHFGEISDTSLSQIVSAGSSRAPVSKLVVSLTFPFSIMPLPWKTILK